MSAEYYCEQHKWNPPEGSGFCFCPRCEFEAPEATGDAGAHLRWHRLEEITRDDVGTIMLLAATCDDGVGIIAQWCLLPNRSWEVFAMDTECNGGMQKVTDFHEGEPVPPTPPTVFDDLIH